MAKNALGFEKSLILIRIVYLFIMLFIMLAELQSAMTNLDMVGQTIFPVYRATFSF